MVVADLKDYSTGAKGTIWNHTVQAVNLGAKFPNEVQHTISSFLHLRYIFSKLLTGSLRHPKGSIMLGRGNSVCRCMLIG